MLFLAGVSDQAWREQRADCGKKLFDSMRKLHMKSGIAEIRFATWNQVIWCRRVPYQVWREQIAVENCSSRGINHA